jgi:hypothetical protein
MSAKFSPQRRKGAAHYTLDKNVLEQIWMERMRQRALIREGRIGFDCACPDVCDDKKLRVLTEELGEVAQAIDCLERPQHHAATVKQLRNGLKDELVQVAAVAVAWLEALEESP